MSILKALQYSTSFIFKGLFVMIKPGLFLWLLTICIPLTVTFVSLFLFIIGLVPWHEFVELLHRGWIKFYITGTFQEIPAWRIHMGLIFGCILFTIPYADVNKRMCLTLKKKEK